MKGNKRGFSLLEKGVKNLKKETTRKNPAELGLNLSYQCKLMYFNKHRNEYRCEYVHVYIYIL